MTVRSSDQALQNQKWRRSQTLCSVFEITRLDGNVLRLTDHDKPLTIDGVQYLPASLGTLSAEQRDAALRASTQDASGFVDGTLLTIPDLMGNKYRGARVVQTLVDWRRPWVWHYRSLKRIRQMAYDGTRWTATLEGIGARLQQNVGGRFGGTHSQTCTYILGDQKTCKADLSGLLEYNPAATFLVQNITLFTSTPVLIRGQSVSWTTNQWAGYRFVLRSGNARGEERRIVSNTSDVLTLDAPLSVEPAFNDSAWIGQGPRVASIDTQRMIFALNTSDFPSTYSNNHFRDGEIEWVTGANVGTISPIVESTGATRSMRLLLPTPFDITVGDRGIVRPGCDGLVGTCNSKFRQFPFRVGTLTTGSTSTVINPLCIERTATTTAGSTTTSIVDSTLAVTTQPWANGEYIVRITSGVLSGQERTITGLAANTIFVSPPLASAPVVGVGYTVVRSHAYYSSGYYKLRMTSGAQAGQERDIASATSQVITLASALPGAPSGSDGYEIVKTNLDNFGGTDVFSPGASKTLEQPE
jgi:uncharacterized phage protein (TIGR02218 family)